MDSNQTAIRKSALTLPGYTLISELGIGGMATVYLAIQTSFGRKIALKVMSPALATDPSYGERFLREARIAATMSHPHLITVYDVGIHEHCSYIAMEYHPGGDLKQRIQRGMSPKAAENTLRQMASALDYAHTKGYIHRDVKPDNILFREDGSAVLTDFGIARPTEGQTRMTQLGMIVGTPKYMSPEQARGKEVGAHSDLYALGIVFYEMLTGTVPFEGADSIEIGIKHLREPVPPLPADVAAYQPIIDRLLAKAPEDRYAQGHELLQDLRPQVGARVTETPTRTLRAKPDDHPTDTLRPRVRSRGHRRPWKTVAALVAIAAAGSGSHWWFGTPEGSHWWQTQADRPGLRNAATMTDQWLSANNIPVRVSSLLPTGHIAPPMADAPPLPVQAQPPANSNTVATATPATPLTTSRENRSLAAQAGLGGPDPLRPQNLVSTETLDKIEASAEHKLAEGLTASALGGSPAPVLTVLSGVAAAVTKELPAAPNQRSAADRRQVQSLLTRAANAIQAGHLTEPAGNNAVAYYRQALAIDADNGPADDGLKIIASHLVKLATGARQASNFKRAKTLLNKAAAAAPVLPAISAERRSLAAAQQAQAKAESQRADVMLGQFRIKGLLLQADTSMRQEHFVAPAGDNALDKYREVLRLEPSNAIARKGLQQLEATLADRLQAALAVTDWGRVEQLIAQLQHIDPGNPAIARARATLATQRATEPAR